MQGLICTVTSIATERYRTLRSLCVYRFRSEGIRQDYEFHSTVYQINHIHVVNAINRDLLFSARQTRVFNPYIDSRDSVE